LTTDSNGAFTVPAGYGCPASSSQLYLIVRGGSVGNAASNAAIALATPMGECSEVSGSAKPVVNEVTTAATAWGLAQFLSAGGNAGATSTNTQGVANAVATVGNLANLTSGTSPGATFPSTGTSPASKINSLANLLNTCTSTPSGTGCSSLFAATTPGSGAAPDNTLDAALNIVRNPGTNIGALYTQSATNSTFQPALSAAPSDWTLFINYTGEDMYAPSGVGVDSIGNVWVASYANPTLEFSPGVVSEFSPTGSPVFPSGITSGGLLDSYGLAIDGQNNVWVPDEQSTGVNNNLGSVTVLNSSGQLVSGATGFSTGGLDYPVAVAIDPSDGNAWVVNNGNQTLTLFSSTGQPLSGAKGFTSTQLAFPVAIAIDASHNAWVGNSSGSTVTKVSADGSQFTSYACCDSAYGLAIDQRGNVWVANYYGDSISLLSSSGSVISSGYSDNKASIYHPQGIAVDGSGTVWVANFLGNSITELAGSGAGTPGQILSPPTGYERDASFLKAYALAIDASGNVWVTNFGNNTLTEVIGLAAPVKTPQLGPVQSP
jgi:streptogramin lyase